MNVGALALASDARRCQVGLWFASREVPRKTPGRLLPKIRMNAPTDVRQPGAQLCGKWRIDRVMRVGTTAITYAATHRNGAPVALKVLHRRLAQDPDLGERFRREAYAANTVPHPGIVKIVDDDTTEDGSPVLVMDFVEGEPLEELRRAWGGRLPLDVAVDFCVQLLEIVAVAHDHGIVHRDLQPESVIVAPGGRVKLFDFGIAKVRTSNMTEEDLTGTGVILGAPPFMAPEQALGRRELVDAQTDIYSVGATLYVLLSGQGLHDAPTPLAQIIAASSTPARSLRSVVNADLVPDAVVKVVDRALAFRKSDRWLDARTFASALRDACNGTLGQEAHPADHESDSPTLASGTELEPALLENLTAAQGIDLANPPPYTSPVHVQDAHQGVLLPEPVDDPTIPVPDSVVLAARLGGLELPGQAPVASARNEHAPQVPKPPPSSKRIVRQATSAPRMQAEPSPSQEPAVETASDDDDVVEFDMHDEPMLSFPAKRHEVKTDEDSVIVNATPVPPPMAHPMGSSPQSPMLGGYSPGPQGAAYSGMAVPPAPGSSPSFAEPPPRRPRAHEPTVMLVPKAAEEAPKNRSLLFVVLGVSTLAVVLLLANLFMMRR